MRRRGKQRQRKPKRTPHLDNATLRVLRARNALDAELYAYAKTVFEAQVAEMHAALCPLAAEDMPAEKLGGNR